LSFRWGVVVVFVATICLSVGGLLLLIKVEKKVEKNTGLTLFIYSIFLFNLLYFHIFPTLFPTEKK
jgi:hypothetical protein